MKHYTPEYGENEQETITEDGKHKYYRLAIPMPFKTGLIVKRYQCQCGRKFTGDISYELHYRKAYEEEKHLAKTCKHRFSTVGDSTDSTCDKCGILQSEVQS